MTFGWLANPSASLQQLAQTASVCGADLSPQALDQRFTQASAACLKQVLEAAVAQVITADPVALPVLRRFTSVELIDSSIICLPDALLPVWRGCGGTRGQSSSLKVELGLELLTGRLSGPHLHDGRTADCKGILQHRRLAPGSLRIADLAYFKLESLQELSAQPVYWISRLKTATGLLDQQGKAWRLLELIRAQKRDRIEVEIKLGRKEQIACRLIAVRVSEVVAAERRRRMRDKARRNCRPLKKESLALADWTILITNVEAEKLSLQEVLVVARARWQIELLFKLWKSHGQIDAWRSQKPWRILTELYAKLLAMLIQHWVLVVGGWGEADKSLMKASKGVQMLALHLAAAMGSIKALTEAIKLIGKCIARRCRVEKRKKVPSSFQLLLNEP
ncbi:MAG TPA: IS4 family transposase [Blastocatellia bacterium]|nr:IS4 family transposase [Blastocatellia bacterium]